MYIYTNKQTTSSNMTKFTVILIATFVNMSSSALIYRGSFQPMSTSSVAFPQRVADVEREKTFDANANINISGNGNFYTRKFGEFCNSTHKCNYLDWLTCSNTPNTALLPEETFKNSPTNTTVSTNQLQGKCICRFPDKLFYDARSKRCVARLWNTCRLPVSVQHPFDDDPSTIDDHTSKSTNLTHSYTSSSTSSQILALQSPNTYPSNNKKFKRIDCVQNAICDTDLSIFRSPTCKCHKGFFATTDCQCEMQKSVTESCNSDKECIILLACINSTCQCKDPRLVFDKKEKRCSIPHGGRCETSQYGSDSLSHRKSQNCTTNAYCHPTTKTCQCKVHLAISDDGLCRPVYREPCSQENSCADLFACHNGICKCKYPFHQFFDEPSKECLSLVKGPCEENSRVYKCTANAFCADSVEGTFKECQCIEGYLDSIDGQCIKGYAMECKNDTECYPNLFCMGKCQCKDEFQRYDPVTRECQGKVGSRCLLDGNISTLNQFPISKGFSLNCVPNALCIHPSFKTFYGRCECTQSYKANSDRTCANNNF